MKKPGAPRGAPGLFFINHFRPAEGQTSVCDINHFTEVIRR